jgi:PAS domain S-box-containing protein
MPASNSSTQTKHLAPFAGWILKDHLRSFTKELMLQSREINIPVLKYFEAFSEHDLEQMSYQSNTAWLKSLADDDAARHLELTLQRWISDQLPQIDRDQVVLDDITTVTYVRKKAFLKYIPEYTNDLQTALHLVAEIDQYLHTYRAAMMQTFVDLLENRIREQADLNKKIADTLKESESLYKQAQSITHIGNYVWDLEKNILQWSDELYRIYELVPGKDEINNEIIAAYNHPDDVQMVLDEIRHSIETLEPFDFHYRIFLKNGDMKILHARGEVLKDDHGNASKLFGTAQDVTERQTLLEKLQRSDELYKQAQSLAHIGNWEWDIETNKVTWTDEMFRVYGFEPQSRTITFDNFLPLVHPDDRELVKAETAKSIETGQPNDFYHRIITPAGQVKILHARSEVIRNSSNKPIKLHGTTQDVTIQKQVEEKLLENQNFIEKIANATPSVIASYNINTGKYVFINEGIKKLLGYEPQQVLTGGVSFLTGLIHPDDLQALMKKNSDALATANTESTGNEPIIEFQYRMRHKNGEYRWFHTFGTVFTRNQHKQVEFVLNISLDITERIKAEEVLYQRTLELQRSNANLEEFAFVASHDLKEPLRKISTFSDRLLNKEKENVSTDGLAYLNKIKSSSIRLQTMINDLLSLSLISGDKSFRRTSLQKIWDETLTALENKLDDLGVKIEADSLPDALVIPSQFHQLFLNLLSNSLKFSRPEVTLVIRITHTFLESKKDNAYNLPEGRKYLQINFSDNGIGFDNMFVEKIFAIFQRLNSKEMYEGTGIGLSICKKIVENHGGIILASGIPNSGATFTIIIPD